MKLSRETVIAGIVIGVCLTIGAWASVSRARAEAAASGVGRVLPDVAVHTSPGVTANLRQYVRDRGYTVIAVFSPNCVACIAEAQVWESLARAHKGRLTFLGLAETADTGRVAYVVREAGVSFPVPLVDRRTVQLLDADPMPRIFVVNARREVLFTAFGHTSTAELSSWVERSVGN